MLAGVNFDSFVITYLDISRSLWTFYILIEVVLNSSQMQNGLELVFRSQHLQNFLVIFFFCNMM